MATFIGTPGNDTLVGSSGDDLLKGLAGDDVLLGSDGNDILVGGQGNDVLDGGTGFNTVDYSQDGGSHAVTVNFATGTATDTFGGTDTLANIQAVIGTNSSDTFIANTVDGVSYTFNGKAGTDTVDFSGSTNNLDVDMGTGQVTGSGIGTDTLISIENVKTGSGDDVFHANTNESGIGIANTFDGGGGTNTLDYSSSHGPLTIDVVADGILPIHGVATGAGIGHDSFSNFQDFVGGTGPNTIDFSASTEDLTVDVGAGTASGTNLGTVTFANFHTINTGSGNDEITADGLGDTINAGTGNDTLIGGAGNDTLESAGASDFTGGGGNDLLIGVGFQGTAHYSGNWADYTVTQIDPDTYQVIDNRGGPGAGPDGTDTLVQIGSLQFADVGLSIDDAVNQPPVLTPVDVSESVTEDAPAAVSGNLVTNGDFETGDSSGWTLTGNTGFTGVNQGEGASPHGGSDAFSFGAIGSDSILSQTIATTPGAYYEVDFWLENQGAPPNDFTALWNGTQLLSLANEGPFGYHEYSFDVLATGTSTTLEFDGRQDPSWFQLDDVSVTQETLSTSGTLTYADPNSADSESVPATAAASGAVWTDGTNTFTLSPDQLAALETPLQLTNTPDDPPNTGTINWTYSVPDGATDFLAAGETVTLTYPVTVTDLHGATDTQNVTVTINGVNEAPVANAVQATTDEDTPIAIDVTHSFTDPDVHDTHTYIASSLSTDGATIINNGDGTFTYDPTNAAFFETLPIGTTTDTF